MGRYILTAPVVALTVSAVPAQAQEFTWTGFYVGAHGALVDTQPEWNGSNVYQTVVDGGEGSFTLGRQTDTISEEPSNSTFGGGAKAGFNWQTGNFVLGAEADATLFDYTGAFTRTQGGSTYTVLSDASDIETVRARAGVAFDSVLLFATGGVAFSNLKHSLTATNVSQIVIDGGEGGSAIGTSTENLAASADSGTGWTLGGGGEVKLSDRWSASLTVLYVDFGSEALAASAPLSNIAATVDTTMVIGTLGINFRF